MRPPIVHETREAYGFDAAALSLSTHDPVAVAESVELMTALFQRAIKPLTKTCQESDPQTGHSTLLILD